MLILSRRPGETIKVGDGIEITLVSINGQQASIGIKAPKDVHIERDDIIDRAPKNQQRSPR